MAGYSNSASFFDTAAGGTIANSSPMTVGIGDLILVMIGTTGQTAHATVSDNNPGGGGAYAEVISKLRTTSLDNITVFVRNNRINDPTATTFTGTIGANSGAFIAILAVAGMTKYGASAIREAAGDSNQTVGNPTINYDGAAVDANFQLTGYWTNANPPSAPGPDAAYWFSRINGGYATPTTGFQLYTSDTGGASHSGGTPSQVQWQGSAGNAYADFGVELDASPDPAAAAATTPFPPLGRGATW